jgi:hypothetical protein
MAQSVHPVREAQSLVQKVIKLFFLLKATTLYPGGIRSHNPSLQSLQWQAELTQLDHAAGTMYTRRTASRRTASHRTAARRI